MSEELKKLIKARTKGKEKPTCLFIKIREAVDVTDLQIKDQGNGITELRVHSTNEKFPKWYTHGYLIDLENFHLTLKELKKKKDFIEYLTNPSRVRHQPTRQLLEKLNRDYGGIIPDGRNKLFWKTEKFKKYKDPYRVKMKTL